MDDGSFAYLHIHSSAHQNRSGTGGTQRNSCFYNCLFFSNLFPKAEQTDATYSSGKLAVKAC